MNLQVFYQWFEELSKAFVKHEPLAIEEPGVIQLGCSLGRK